VDASELNFNSIESVLDWATRNLKDGHYGGHSPLYFKRKEVKAKYKGKEEIYIKVYGNRVTIKADYCSQFIKDLKEWVKEIYENCKIEEKRAEFYPLDYFIFEKMCPFAKFFGKIFERIKKSENGKVVRKQYYCNKGNGNEKVLMREEYEFSRQNAKIEICFSSTPEFALAYGTSLSKASVVVEKHR